MPDLSPQRRRLWTASARIKSKISSAGRAKGLPRSVVKKDFAKLVDGGASSPARCRVSNLRFEPSAVSPSAKPENPLGFQPSCHPYQFLLKSFGFPGAKTARKRFLLWKMGFSAAKILPYPPYMPLGTIEIREGFGPLELSKGFSTVCGEGQRPSRIFYGNLLARRGVFIYNIMWMFGWRLMAWSRETPAGPLR